jgi:hypothetical protein
MNEKFVGFAFNRSEYFTIKRFINLFKIADRINAIKNVPRINAP